MLRSLLFRLVFSSGNAILNDAAFDHILHYLQSRYPRLGEIIMLTKNQTVSQGSNTRKFTLLATLRLRLTTRVTM